MIWLIGKNGMLGKELSRLFDQNKMQWVGTDAEVDITSPEALETFASSHDVSAGRTGNAVSKGAPPAKITWVVNCAAYTAVDKAEDNLEIARKVNALGPQNIARTARHIGAKLIHISTDYVFDGENAEKVPYDDEAKKNPQSVYGLTKSEGEDAIQKEMTQYYILRTAWLYGFCGANFVYKMTELMNGKSSLKVVDDQRGTPTCATTLADVIVKIINSSDNAHSLFGKNAAIPYGVYNCTDEGQASWFEFAGKIYEYGRKYGRIQNTCELSACTSEEFPQKAKRPAWSVLSKTKLQSALHIKLPTWENALEKFIKSERFKPL
ncbi:MAG: dTDP-4-dehydrorhamnose reductase [Treponema sp.]|nr:dTDP-4-dehydrorhamnose reductase [Treponema sp.]